MNVAITAPENAYTQRMMQQLQTALNDHTLLPWKSGDKPPAETVDVLLAMGPVKQEDLDVLPGLQLIQTLSDG